MKGGPWQPDIGDWSHRENAAITFQLADGITNRFYKTLLLTYVRVGDNKLFASRPTWRMWSLACRQCSNTKILPSHQIRAVSSSPYGRTHVWKRRPPVLPNPVVPKFPQRIVRSDGSSFTHWTTSPRSTLRLTRDTTNNPIWNTGLWSDDRAVEEEGATTGRLGRFNRKFEELGADVADVSWMENVVESTGGNTGGTPIKKKKI